MVSVRTWHALGASDSSRPSRPAASRSWNPPRVVAPRGQREHGPLEVAGFEIAHRAERRGERSRPRRIRGPPLARGELPPQRQTDRLRARRAVRLQCVVRLGAERRWRGGGQHEGEGCAWREHGVSERAAPSPPGDATTIQRAAPHRQAASGSSRSVERSGSFGDASGDLGCWLDGPELHLPGPFVQVSATANGHACALDANGRATCWGGIGADPALEGSYTAVSAGWRSCALNVGGAVVCWGRPR